MQFSFGKTPSAWVPPAISVVALLLVATRIAIQGGGADRDEGAVAHLWQLLMMAQLPVIAFFAFRWLRRSRRKAVQVLAAQLLSVVAAAALVFMLGWYELAHERWTP